MNKQLMRQLLANARCREADDAQQVREIENLLAQLQLNLTSAQDRAQKSAKAREELEAAVYAEEDAA